MCYYILRITLFYLSETFMARAGILYSHVAQAAVKLAHKGKNPTVDSVREALGGTGSKSTIAPLLKRWKVEHQDTVTTAESGLPAPLLHAVKELHQHMQAEFSQQLDQARQQHMQELHTAIEREQQLRTELQTTLATNVNLTEDLTKTRQAQAQLQDAHHAQSLTLTAVQIENIGLQQRLTDRAAEVTTLDHQLTQTRAQFEHYQEATAAQRTEERQAYEQRISWLDQELASANRQIAGQQTIIGQYEARIANLMAEQERQTQILSAAQEELADARLAQDRLTHRVQDLTVTKDDLMARWSDAQQQLSDTRLALSAQERTTDMLTEQVRHAEERAERLAEEKLTWQLERGALEQRLMSTEQQLSVLSGSAIRP